MTRVQRITGELTPKSVVASPAGQVFAQNMMYTHTVSVFGADGALHKTISDEVDLADFGEEGHSGSSRGAPVEMAFSPDGKTAKTVKARELWDQIGHAAWACADPGIQFHDTVNAWHTCPEDGPIRGSNPCSEYMFLDDTACNLASMNLLTFLKAGQFDAEGYVHATRLWTVTLEISVLMAQFPSKEIAQRSYDFRTLGLGYANIGGLLMNLGLGYDSDEGRALCGALTALMTGVAMRPRPRWRANSGRSPAMRRTPGTCCG